MKRPPIKRIGWGPTPIDMRSAAPPPKRAHPFYYSEEWKKFRAMVLTERGERCEDPAHPADRPREGYVEVDHIIELLDGGARLDRDNLMVRCASCHHKKTLAVRDDRFARPAEGPHGSPHPKWLQPAVVPVTMVCGPPASGKSTYVGTNAGSTDLVIDLDLIIAAMSGLPLHAWSEKTWLDRGLAQRNRLLGALSRRPCRWRAGWFIIGEPTAQGRQWWADTLRPARIVVLKTPERVCLQRIRDDRTREAAHADMSWAVARWFNDYTPRPGDEVLEEGL
jgi:5-methylcytosine-specific restriction protein A